MSKISDAEKPRECVILVHGMGRTSYSMKRVEWILRRAGYQVINLSFPTRHATVERLSGEFLARAISMVPPEAGRINFVTHSLGGIILRDYLASHTLARLGRVVMLAPPNKGSEVADVFRKNSIGRWILGPAGCELGTAETDLPRRLGPVHFDLGIIAGDRSLEPWLSRWIVGPNDGKVSVVNTKVDGMTAFLIVHHSHTWMMWRSAVLGQIVIFLKSGSFDKTKIREDNSSRRA